VSIASRASGSAQKRGGDEEGRSAVLRDALAIGLTTGAYALSFGALGVTTGLSVLQTCALSLLMFTGASQFALLGVLAAGGGALAAAATAALVGSRNALYALRMAPLLQVRGVRRLLAAQLVIDESTAMAVARPPGPAGRLAFYATGLSVFVCWNLGTLAGALGGQALGDPETYGLDVAASAAFVALIAPQARTREAKLVAVGAAAVALVAVPVLPAGVPVMLGALVAVAVVASRGAGASEGPATARTGPAEGGG
jgi:predicted branched-subunit amino acid permease